MSVLLVEDNPARIKLFQQGFIGTSMAVLTQADLAISWLKDHTPKLILLDYDLHEHGTPIKLSGSGGDVVKYMARYAKRFERSLVVIHSLNRIGAGKMSKHLKNHNLTPSMHPHLWLEPENMERLASVVRES
jgi:CheY-like chemotaxis protein